MAGTHGADADIDIEGDTRRALAAVDRVIGRFGQLVATTSEVVDDLNHTNRMVFEILEHLDGMRLVLVPKAA